MGLLWWLVPGKTPDGWWTCVANTDIQTLLLSILLILKRLQYLSIRVKTPLVPLPQIKSPWSGTSWMDSLHNYPQQQLLSFLLPYILFARGLKMATHCLGYEFAGPSFHSHLCSFAALSSHSEISGWIEGCWIKAFSLWDRGWWCIIFCLNSAEVTLNAITSFPWVLIPFPMWIPISAYMETYSVDAEFPLPKSYIEVFHTKQGITVWTDTYG